MPGPAVGVSLGSAVTLADLDGDPYPLLARLRRYEPVSWLPALNGWLVTRRDLAAAVLRDTAAFTVDDPRFTTARVVGPSMLSLDGPAHARHRAPFRPAFSRAQVHNRLAAQVEAEARWLAAGLAPAGTADLRREFAAPLAAAVMAHVLGLATADRRDLLAWYDAIVGAVTALAGTHAGPGGALTAGTYSAGTPHCAGAPYSADDDGGAGAGECAGAGACGGGGECAAEADARPTPAPSPAGVVAAGTEAFGLLASNLRDVLGAGGPSLLAGMSGGAQGLADEEVISNAAVILFGGIETTEGVIANALLHLLSHPAQLRQVSADPGLAVAAVEESLRLEAAAAMVDRYATRDVQIGGAAIRRGDLVSVSLAAAGRDPAVFTDPDRFDSRRPNSRLHLAFAHGPHFCIGAHLARLEAICAVRTALRLLPGLRLDPGYPAQTRGLVFRKPPSLRVLWDRVPR